MSHERVRPGYAFGEDRMEELRAVVPEAFADGEINWDVLREALGESIEPETSAVEHFGMSWPGKREARRLASIPSMGTLVPCSGEGVAEETTRNIFIEGDNLEVLKLLHKSYARQVKLIYIDPPYNTGNDFIYNDDFVQPLEQYLKLTHQMDEEGLVLTSNPRSSGRFHSSWLNMMYPRLRLGRDLLKEDGVMLVSIDDNEVHNLRQVMNEVFGEENFLAQLVWKKKYTGGKHTRYYVDFHEYILVYARSREAVEEIMIDRPSNEMAKFVEEDEFVKERGRFYVRPLKSNLALRKTLIYPIQMPDGEVMKTQWLVAKDTFDKLLAEGRVEFRQKKNGLYQVYRKYYERDGGGRVKPPSIIDRFPNTEAKLELKRLFGIVEGRDNVLYTVKPTNLIRHIIIPFVGDGDIVLDFFAGSCSTAHTVLKLNNEDDGNRRFIMVQLPEPCNEGSEAYRIGCSTIAELGKERIRRVIKGFENGGSSGDLGFRVFRLDRSNFRDWRDYQGDDVGQIEMLYENAETPLAEGWTREALLTEVMLIQGFPLDSTVAPLSGFSSNMILRVESTSAGHRLFVCLDERIRDETIKSLKLHGDATFVCLDSALTDQAKVSLSDKCNLATI